MYSRQPSSRFPGGGGLIGFGGPIPVDVWALLGVIFVTFSMQFFEATAIVPALMRLTPLVWLRGFVWQIFTYPFSGAGAPGFLLLLELFFLALFAKDVFSRLGRRNFWLLLAWTMVPAAVVALAVDGIGRLLGTSATAPFVLMQGQHTVFVVLIAAFATLNREATIYLFFILPIRARWFIPVELVLAFFGFLRTKDFTGFVGLVVAIGLTIAFLTPGGFGKMRREWWLRLQHWYLRVKMNRLRRKRGFRVVNGGGPTIN